MGKKQVTYTDIIKVAYKGHRKLANKVNDVFFWIPFAATALGAIGLFIFRPADFKAPGVIISLSAVAFIFLTFLFFRFYILVAVRKTGAPMDVPSDAALVKGIVNVLTLDKSKIEENLTAAVSVNDIDSINKLFDEAYTNSLWTKHREKIKARNAALITNEETRNTIRLIKNSKGGGSNVGYTQVLPLTEDGWNLFQAGKISGAEIDHHFISFEKPYGLLILTLVNSENKDYPANSQKMRLQTGRVTTKALAQHLALFFEKHFIGDDFIPMMFESINPQVAKFIKKYKTNKEEYSADGAEIFCFMFQNPKMIP